MVDFSHVLIITDLDFTFFARGTKMIPRNVEAIERFKAAGGRFSVATGRGFRKFLTGMPEARKLLNAPAVLCNGGRICDLHTGATLGGAVMNHERVVELIRFIYAHTSDKVGVRVTTDKGYLVDADRLTQRLQWDVEGYPADEMDVLPLGQWDEKANPQWIKAVVRGAPEELTALRPLVEAAFAEDFEYNSSSDTFYEFQPRGCNKGVGMQTLAAYLAQEEGHPFTTVAIGDHENDLPMLRIADMAGCPANAIDAVKAVSDYVVCDCDEGALADLIEAITPRFER